MKTKIENIKNWCRYNGVTGIVADTGFEHYVFIPESEIETTDIDGNSANGLAPGCYDQELFSSDYSHDNPMDVEPVLVRNFKKGDWYKRLRQEWLPIEEARIETAAMQLCVTTDWRSDYTSERTKMMNRIEECRRNGTPCGGLRAEWEKIVDSYDVTLDNGDSALALLSMDDDAGGYTDFECLVDEVARRYGEGSISKDEDDGHVCNLADVNEKGKHVHIELHQYYGKMFKIVFINENGTPLGFDYNHCIDVFNKDTGEWKHLADKREIGGFVDGRVNYAEYYCEPAEFLRWCDAFTEGCVKYIKLLFG